LTPPAPGRYYPVVGNALRTLVLLAVLSAGAFAAGTDYGPLTVTGIVTDKRTGETIKGVTVAIAGTDISARTDVSGRFLITNAPAGRQTLVASYMGFSDTRVSIRVGTRKATYANVVMAMPVFQGFLAGPYISNVATPRPLRERYLSLRTGHVALGLPLDIVLLDVDARWWWFRAGASLGGYRYPPLLTGPTVRAGCTVYERPLRYMKSWPWGSRSRRHKGVYGFLPEVYAQVEACPLVGDMDGGEINSLVIGTVNCACEYYFVRAGAYVGGIAAHSYNYDRTRPFDNWQLLPAFGISATLGSVTTGF
jgi:hypothetical protein